MKPAKTYRAGAAGIRRPGAEPTKQLSREERGRANEENILKKWAAEEARVMRRPNPSGMTRDGNAYNILTCPASVFPYGAPHTVGDNGATSMFQGLQKIFQLGNASVEQGATAAWGTNTQWHAKYKLQPKEYTDGGSVPHDDLVIAVSHQAGSRLTLLTKKGDSVATDEYINSANVMRRGRACTTPAGMNYIWKNREAVLLGSLADMVCLSERAAYDASIRQKAIAETLGKEGFTPVRVHSAAYAMSKVQDFVANGEMPYTGSSPGGIRDTALTLSVLGHHLAASLSDRALCGLPRDAAGEIFGAVFCAKAGIERGAIATRPEVANICEKIADHALSDPERHFDAWCELADSEMEVDRRFKIIERETPPFTPTPAIQPLVSSAVAAATGEDSMLPSREAVSAVRVKADARAAHSQAEIARVTTAAVTR